MASFSENSFYPAAFDPGALAMGTQSVVDPAFDAGSFDKVNAFDVEAFSFGDEPAPTDGVLITAIVGGGIPSHGTLRLRRRDGRTREEIRRDRERFGIVAARVVASVAASQAERLEVDGHKRFEELLRELELRGLEFDARYLEALNEQRQRLIDAEIKVRLRQMLDDEMVVLMLLAAAV